MPSLFTSRRLAATAVLLLVSASSLRAQDAATQPTDASVAALTDVLARRDLAAFPKVWDVDAFCDLAFRNLQTPEGKAAMRDVRGSFDATSRNMISSVDKGMKITLLRRRTMDGQPTLLYRVQGPAGLNYWEFVVAPQAEVKVVDLQVAATGERFSKTIERLITRMLMNAKQQNVVDDFTRVTNQFKTGDFQGVIASFDALDETLKREKLLHVMRLTSASKLEGQPKVLDDAAADFRKRFGDDPAGDLLLVDAYMGRKDYPAAHACVDRLDAAVGGDPYLDVIRAGLEVDAGELPKAKAHAEKARAADAKLFPALDTLLAIALKQGDFDAVAKHLREMEAEPSFGIRFPDDLNDAEDFKAFKASPQYQKWLADRKKDAAA